MNQTIEQQQPDFLPYPFKCPVCGALVEPSDFITSYQLVAFGNEPYYQVLNQCRTCRDSNLNSFN